MCIENIKKDRTFAAQKLMGSDHHRVLMNISGFSGSNQKERPQPGTSHNVLSDDETDFFWDPYNN
jgi:hypothetical protein